jgi:Bacterial Ig-like domain (group 3)
MTLTASAPLIAQGEPLTLTVHLPANATGTVGFYAPHAIARAPIINGIATYTTRNLRPGTHTLTASFGGDENWAPNDSKPVTIRIVDVHVNVSFRALMDA